jgi:hypothetical protein
MHSPGLNAASPRILLATSGGQTRFAGKIPMSWDVGYFSCLMDQLFDKKSNHSQTNADDDRQPPERNSNFDGLKYIQEIYFINPITFYSRFLYANLITEITMKARPIAMIAFMIS